MEGTVLGYQTSNLNKKKKILSEGDAVEALVELKRKGEKLESGTDLGRDISRFVGKDVSDADIALGILKDKEDKRKTEQVDREIEERSKVLAKDKGIEAQERIKSELENIVGLKEFRSSDEESAALARAISGSDEVDIETQVAAKEAKLSLDKWQESEIEEVRGYRREKFKQEFEAKTKEKNPEINDEQLSLVRQKADLIADVYFSDGGIENQKDKALEANKGESMGKLESSWSGVEGVVGFLRKTSAETKEILSKNRTIDAGLEGVDLPYENFANARSFDTITSSLNDTNTFGMFASIQNGAGFLGRSLRTISQYTGGWWEKGATTIANHFASRIGNQAVSSFVQNSMSLILKNGLKAGTQAVLKGAAAAGAKVAAGALGAAAGVATGPVGWLVTAGLAVKNFLGKIASKLGINFISKMKEAMAITGNKGLDLIIQGAMLLVGIPALIGGLAFGIGGIALGLIGGLFGAGMIQQSELISGLVPGDFDESNTNILGSYTDNFSIISTPLIVCEGDRSIYESELKSKVAAAGYRTRFGVVAAAQYLAEDFPYKIPYYWSGKYDNNEGLSTQWGCNRPVTSASSVSVIDSVRPYGMDGAGFVRWALKNGGFDAAGIESRDGSNNQGDPLVETISFSEVNCDKIRSIAKPGDVVVNSIGSDNSDWYTGMIIGITQTQLKIAQSGGTSDGIGVVFIDICTGQGSGNDFGYFKSMDNYYEFYSDGEI